MELSDRNHMPPSLSIDVDSDEAIARQLHEMEVERASHLGGRQDTLSLPYSRLFCISKRTVYWVYFVYLILELAAMIPVMILSANERYVCEHSNLRVWIILWESRILVALPLVAVKLCTRHQSFAFELINAMLSIYVLVLFFWGNVLLFSPGASGCYMKSPISLAFVTAAVAVMYAYIAVPVVTIVLVCLCLPLYVLASSVIKSRIERPHSNAIDMAALQTRKFTIESETEGDHPKCAICMNDFVPNESTVTTLPCGHEFDRDCIEYWLSIKKQCAICRQDIGLGLHLDQGPSQPAS